MTLRSDTLFSTTEIAELRALINDHDTVADGKILQTKLLLILQTLLHLSVTYALIIFWHEIGIGISIAMVLLCVTAINAAEDFIGVINLARRVRHLILQYRLGDLTPWEFAAFSSDIRRQYYPIKQRLWESRHGQA